MPDRNQPGNFSKNEIISLRKSCFEDKIFHFNAKQSSCALFSFHIYWWQLQAINENELNFISCFSSLGNDSTKDIFIAINFNFHSKLGRRRDKAEISVGDEKLFFFISIVIEMHFAMSGAENACNASLYLSLARTFRNLAAESLIRI